MVKKTRRNNKITDPFNINKYTDFRDKITRDKETKYVSTLLENDELYEFASNILFLIIKHSKTIGMSKEEIGDIIKSYKTNKLIIKLGYNVNDISAIYNIKTLDELIKWNRENDITLLQIMSSFYKFQANNEFVKKCIEHDKTLKDKFMTTVRQYFKLPDSMTYEHFKQSIIDKSYGGWFYLWIITFLQSSKINLLHHHADVDPDYVRMWASGIEFSKRKNSSQFKLHKLTRKNIKFDQLHSYKEKTLVSGKTYMRPRINGIWFNIMKLMKKEVIAGPSSSAILAYQMIFDLSKILPQTNHNKILLLKCMVADYSIYYHSISEILQTYVSEAGLPTYTLGMNDLEYLKKIQNNLR